ncbi:hypothetical protein B0H11DRAFT_2226129 [Mycena galericulata]|nr:hypothetical protein B0H11DRAFT_2226129 [Mycena galericulata]
MYALPNVPNIPNIPSIRDATADRGKSDHVHTLKANLVSLHHVSLSYSHHLAHPSLPRLLLSAITGAEPALLSTTVSCSLLAVYEIQRKLNSTLLQSSWPAHLLYVGHLPTSAFAHRLLANLPWVSLTRGLRSKIKDLPAPRTTPFKTKIRTKATSRRRVKTTAVCIKAGDDAQDVPSFRTPQASRPTTRPQDSDDLQDVSGFQTPGKRIKTAGDVQDGPSFKSKDKTPRLFKPKTSSRKRIKVEDDPRLRTRPQDPSKSPPQVGDATRMKATRKTSRVPRRHKLHDRQDHETLQTQDVKAEDNAQDLPSVKTQFRRGVSKRDPDTKDYAQDLPNFKTDPPQRGPESKNYPRLEDDV